MANEILVHTSGSVLCWADTTDYVSTASQLTRTHQIDLTSLAANAARQAEKADLGVKRPGGYVVKVSANFASAPTAGGPVEYYWSSSPSATAAIGNTGGVSVSGLDANWYPGGGAEADIDEWKQQLSFVGVLPAAADGAVEQVKVINSYFTPPERYGQWVVKNDTSVALAPQASGMYIALIPVTDELQ